MGKSAGRLAPNGHKSAWVQNRIGAIKRLHAAVLPSTEARSLDGWRYIGGTKSLHLHGGGGAARGMVSQYMGQPVAGAGLSYGLAIRRLARRCKQLTPDGSRYRPGPRDRQGGQDSGLRYCGPGECPRAALWRDRGQKIGQIQPHPCCHPTFYVPPSTLYPHIPPVCLRPTSPSSRLTNLPPLYPPCSPTPLPGVIPRSNFRPISLYSYIPILLPPNKTPAAADPPAIPLQSLLGARCRFRAPRRGRRWPGRRRHFAPPAAC